MARIQITGSGMVAGGLATVADARGNVVEFLPRQAVDVTDQSAVSHAISAFNPDIIFHTAAETGVNYCERNPEAANLVNVTGTTNVITAAAAFSKSVVLLSTDYVFDGSNELGWVESDKPSPLNVYGLTKHAAERFVLDYDYGHVMRTSGIFGLRADGLPERNFFKAISDRVTSTTVTVPVVADQYTAVTYSPFLGEMALDLYESGLPRISHLVCEGSDSWAGWAELATGILGFPASRIEPVPSKSQITGTIRPTYSVLKSSSGTGLTVGRFEAREGIRRYLKSDLGL